MVRIRAAGDADLPELLRLDGSTFGEHAYPPSVARQLLDISPGLVLLAETEDEGSEDAASACGFVFAALAAGGEVGWILALGVEPFRRRLRVGTELTDAVIERLAALGGARVRLTVAPDSRAALSFYEGLGFAAVERFADYLGPGRDRLVLERDLLTR